MSSLKRNVEITRETFMYKLIRMSDLVLTYLLLVRACTA
jgi:hypothetical protein